MWSEIVGRGAPPQRNAQEQKREICETVQKTNEDIFPFLHGAREFYNALIKNNSAFDFFSGTGLVGYHLQRMGVK